MAKELLFLDTNIPIYAAGKLNEYKKPCLKVLESIESGELRIAIDTEVIQEILYRYHRIGLYREAVELAWNMLRLRLRVLPITKKDVEAAVPLYAKYSSKGIPPRDTLHVAVMLNNGMNKIISVDKHFDEVISEVQRVDPKEIGQ